jgi:hypothetical protein
MKVAGSMTNPAGYNLPVRQKTSTTGDQLANALHVLGVNFIRGGTDTDVSLSSHPSRLIAALAQSDEARLRLSLIPLFLEHPEYAPRVRAVAKKLDRPVQLTLECYYNAAVWLAKKYQLNISLPDHFSKDLNLTPVDDPDENLRALAKRHADLSGSYVNWLATYQHAEQIWRKGFDRRNKVTLG